MLQISESSSCVTREELLAVNISRHALLLLLSESELKSMAKRVAKAVESAVMEAIAAERRLAE